MADEGADGSEDSLCMPMFWAQELFHLRAEMETATHRGMPIHEVVAQYLAENANTTSKGNGLMIAAECDGCTNEFWLSMAGVEVVSDPQKCLEGYGPSWSLEGLMAWGRGRESKP